MNIIVISRSAVVKELLKLTLNKENLSTQYTDSSKNIGNSSYDFIFLDDSVINLDMELEYINSNLSKGKLIFIGNNKQILSKVDKAVKKPFLPRDIESIIKEAPKKKEIKTNILDPQEIAKIKELMECDISDSMELNYIDLLEDRQDLNLKKKDAKELLYDLSTLSKKEIKKLLKGAKVSIKINFKRKDNE